MATERAALKEGTRLGPYEVVAPVGAGGMGEVYQARDTRLGRSVAVKVLPSDLASDPDRRKRFEREARAVAALSHPNICTIFDVGREEMPSGPVDYLVMELLEGETLAQRLRRGPMPTEPLLKAGIEIASALNKAHRAGVVHRDVKPGNIVLTKTGAKLLDFGLARLRPTTTAMEGEGTGVTGQATRGDSLTDEGKAVGTYPYMAPEQLEGKVVDARADLFALGAVLYEMATGRRAFEGASHASVAAAILTSEPTSLTSLRPMAPPALEGLVKRLLAKDPDERMESAHDVVLRLRDIADGATGDSTVVTGQARSLRGRRWPVVAMASTVLSALLAVLLYLKPSGSDIGAHRFTPFATDPETEQEAAWSPDGRSIAYMKVVGGHAQIFVRSLDADSPVQLTHVTDDARRPFWWPDSSRIGFLTPFSAEVWSVGSAGGEPGMVQKARARAAALSLDGKTLATWRVTTGENVVSSSVWLASPPTAEPRKYTPAPFEVGGEFGPNYLRFSPDGTQILAAFHGPSVAVWLLPFPDGAGAHGTPHQIFKDAPSLRIPPAFSWMPDSRHVVLTLKDTSTGRARLWMADTRAETLRPLTAGVMNEDKPDVSPDGSKIVFTSGGMDFDLVDVPLDTSAVRDLLVTSRNEHDAAWVPGASKFVYMTDRSGREEVRVRSRTESWDRPIVTQRDFPEDTTQLLRGLDVSPDGQQVAYERLPVNGPPAIWISPITCGVPARLVRTPGNQYSPTWSPDGEWLAFFWTQGGVTSLAKSRVGGTEPPRVLLEVNDSTGSPAWSPNGDWIAYPSREGVNLVNPDEKEKRLLAKVLSDALLWSRDGAMLYTITGRDDPGGVRLVGLDLKTGSAKSIRTFGDEFYFGTPVDNQRLTLAPEGRSFSATVFHVRTDIWLLEGFNERKGLVDWFR